MNAPQTKLLPLSFIAILLLLGCEENPITEGLLKASPPDNGRNNRVNEEEVAEALAFTGVYQGETGQAIIADTDDAVTMAVSSYRLWHLQRMQQSLDNLVRDLIIAEAENRPVNPAQIWTNSFGGANCGDESAVSISNDGAEGNVDFNDFCVVGVTRTDNHPFTLSGSLQWQNGRVADTDSFDNQRPASRTVSFDDLQVQWRGETYSLSGRNILSSDGSRFLGGLDAQLAGSEREWRILTQRLQGTNEFMQQLMVDNLGAMVMNASSTWVSPAAGCPDSRGAGSGQNRLSGQDDDNPAFFQVELASCDQFNLLPSPDRSAVDSSDRPLDNGPFNLSDKL